MKTFLATLLFAYTFAEETTSDEVVRDTADDTLWRTGEKTEFTFHEKQWTGSYVTKCENASDKCSFEVDETYVLGGYATSDWVYYSQHWAVMKQGDETTNMWAVVANQCGNFQMRNACSDLAVNWTGWYEIKEGADLAQFTSTNSNDAKKYA